MGECAELTPTLYHAVIVGVMIVVQVSSNKKCQVTVNAFEKMTFSILESVISKG